MCLPVEIKYMHISIVITTVNNLSENSILYNLHIERSLNAMLFFERRLPFIVSKFVQKLLIKEKLDRG